VGLIKKERANAMAGEHLRSIMGELRKWILNNTSRHSSIRSYLIFGENIKNDNDTYPNG
jgi:hypothetical protein